MLPIIVDYVEAVLFLGVASWIVVGIQIHRNS